MWPAASCRRKGLNMKYEIFLYLVITALMAGVIGLIGKAETAKRELAELQDHIPTVRELQIKLDSKGYKVGKIDGILGAYTKNAWVAAINDQYAAEHFGEKGE